MLKGLKDAGVIDRLGRGGEVEVAPEPGEEQPEDVTGPEALFVGSGNPLAQYFDDVPNAGGEEDFNAEEEPTVGDIEPGTPVSAASMSDEDYEAFMKYGELSDRLAATKSNLLKMKRRKGGVAGDISDKPSNEEQNLRNLKKSLEDRINALPNTGTESAANGVRLVAFEFSTSDSYMLVFTHNRMYVYKNGALRP